MVDGLLKKQFSNLSNKRFLRVYSFEILITLEKRGMDCPRNKSPTSLDKSFLRVNRLRYPNIFREEGDGLPEKQFSNFIEQIVSRE